MDEGRPVLHAQNLARGTCGEALQGWRVAGKGIAGRCGRLCISDKRGAPCRPPRPPRSSRSARAARPRGAADTMREAQRPRAAPSPGAPAQETPPGPQRSRADRVGAGAGGGVQGTPSGSLVQSCSRPPKSPGVHPQRPRGGAGEETTGGNVDEPAREGQQVIRGAVRSSARLSLALLSALLSDAALKYASAASAAPRGQASTRGSLGTLLQMKAGGCRAGPFISRCHLLLTSAPPTLSRPHQGVP